jgi:dTDP-4-dehydrorhamnose reductase
MRVLVTGASGFVGSHLIAAMQGEHDVVGTRCLADRSAARSEVRLDLTDSAALESCLEHLRPAGVVHCAAHSRVIGCEDAPAAATAVNVTATEGIARWCRKQGAKLIFFSSDQVFDGQRGRYLPDDSPAPINHYGRTKLVAESVVLDASSRNAVVRSNSVVGKTLGFGESFTDWVHHALLRGERVSCFSDQYRSPIHISTICALIALCLRDDISDVIHAGGTLRLSRLDTAALVAGDRAAEIVQASYLSHPRHSIMPADTSYDPQQMHSLIGADACDLSEALARDYAETRVLS